MGPHFITVYSTDLVGILEMGKRLYPLIQKYWTDIADIQQVDLVHEHNDPKVYHVYGTPNVDCGKKAFRHFHVRLGRKPVLEDIEKLYKLMKMTKYFEISIADITYQEDNKCTNEAFVYPAPPEGNDLYLRYIQDLKNDKY